MRQLNPKKVRQAVAGVAERLPRRQSKKPAVTRGRALIGGGVLVLVAGAAFAAMRKRGTSGELQIAKLEDCDDKPYVVVHPVGGIQESFLISAKDREVVAQYVGTGQRVRYRTTKKQIDGMNVGCVRGPKGDNA